MSDDQISCLQDRLNNVTNKLDKLENSRIGYRFLVGLLIFFMFIMWSESRKDQTRIANLLTDIKNYNHQINSIQDQLDDLTATLIHLEDESDKFDDGVTDWKDVVPEVKSLAREADSSVEDIKSSVEELANLTSPP